VATVWTECEVFFAKYFWIGKGSSTLSPMLFNAERIMREAELENDEVGILIGGMLINNLRYADDTTLIASSGKDLQHMIELVQRASE